MPAPSTDRIPTGILLMIGFCTIAPLIDVASKLATQSVPVGTVSLARFAVQAALMAPVMAVLGAHFRLSRQATTLIAARATSAILASLCFIAALSVMPIADALAIAFVEPFIILLIGALVLKEQVGPRRLIASCIGFLGALFIIRPSFVQFGLVALLPLGTALFFALYILITRGLSRHADPMAMQFYTALFAVALCIPILLVAGALGAGPQARLVWPEGIGLIWCVAVGLAGTVSHLAMTYALRYAPSATLAPLHYLEMVPAALFGFLVFGDWPHLLTWAGIALIVGSGLYIIYRERGLARKAPQ